MIDKQVLLKKQIVLDWFDVDVFKAYHMGVIDGVLLIHVLEQCLSGDLPMFVFEGARYFYVNLESMAQWIMTSVHELNRYYIIKWSGNYGKDIKCELPPFLLKRRKERKWFFAFNKKALLSLLDVSRHEEVAMLFELENEVKARVKTNNTGKVKALNARACLPGVMEVFNAFIGRVLPGNDKLFHHKNMNTKTIKNAIVQITRIREGTFFDQNRFDESFLKKMGTKDGEKLKKEVEALALMPLDEFVGRMAKALNNYAESFKTGVEPSNKKYLTRSMSDYFFNCFTHTSYFLSYFNHKPDSLSENSADRVFSKLPGRVQDLGELIYKNNKMAVNPLTFWSAFKNLYQALCDYKKKTTVGNYWFDNPVDALNDYYEWLKEKGWSGTVYPKHLRPDGLTFRAYLDSLALRGIELEDRVLCVFDR